MQLTDTVHMNARTEEKISEIGEHPIQVVAQRTGLSTDVLRIWERRYAVVKPPRSATGRRLYSDRDIEHLVLLRRATLAGRSISQVAELETEELRGLVDSDDVAAARSPRVAAGRRQRTGGETRRAVELLTTAMTAAENLEAEAFERALSVASLELTPTAVVNDVVVPLMHEIGLKWKEGHLRIANEHMASAVIRTFLGNHISRTPTPEGAPVLIAGAPAGHHHEFGALIVVATAAAAGWRSIYLGPNLPAAEFASVARGHEARAIALSLIYPVDDPRLADELREIRRLSPKTTDIVVGGPAARAYESVIGEIGAHYSADMEGLKAVLEGLRLRRN
jgi:methanogenic corrinoid protein MtbC1